MMRLPMHRVTIIPCCCSMAFLSFITAMATAMCMTCLRKSLIGGLFFLAGSQLWEMAADDWSAAVALLQYHARLMEDQEGKDAPATVLYNVPPTSPVLHWMVDNLEVVDISTWDWPTFGWAVHEQT